MARPKSNDKRIALLNAATMAVGMAGIGASTATIARKAGVAEGTLFRYFANKDALLNALFLYLQQSLGEAMMVGFDPTQEPKSCTRHIWNQFIAWGLANPNAQQAIRQLAVSDKITPETLRESKRSTRSCTHWQSTAFAGSFCTMSGVFSPMPFSFAWRRPPWNLPQSTRMKPRTGLTPVLRPCGAPCRLIPCNRLPGRCF